MTTSKKKPQSIPVNPIALAHPSAWEAFLATAEERRAIPDTDAVTVNTDVGDAVVIALGAAPAVTRMRTQLLTLPDFRATSVDRLEVYALAVSCAHGLYQAARQPHGDLPTTAARGSIVRARFLSAARSLADWDLFPAERLDEMNSGPSFQSIGADLIALGSWFNANWDAIKSRCAATQDDVTEALAIGDEILTMLGLRGTQPVTESALERRRAFALLDGAYDEIRRGLAWLRWQEGDAEQIAPSLRGHRGPQKKTASSEPTAPVEPNTGSPVIAWPVAKPVAAPVIAPPVAPMEGTTDKPVPVSEPFTH